MIRMNVLAGDRVIGIKHYDDAELDEIVKEAREIYDVGKGKVRVYLFHCEKVNGLSDKILYSRGGSTDVKA